jgi:hypothetical protein
MMLEAVKLNDRGGESGLGSAKGIFGMILPVTRINYYKQVALRVMIAYGMERVNTKSKKKPFYRKTYTCDIHLHICDPPAQNQANFALLITE